MHLARVTGAVVSTQKSPSLIGKKLLLVRRVSADGELPLTPLTGDEVAVDSVGAGVGWYFSAVVPAPDMCFPALTRPSTWQWSALSIRFRAKELKDGNLYPNR
ncbi:propanediol utilization protein PduN [Escherichia coli]|nr:propanediol utilization protein PduN [Escherichia coli]